MASVFHRDGTWVVEWKDGSGRRRTRRTSCATKAEAKRVAADLERQAERQLLGLEPLPTDSRMTLVDLCAWWRKTRKPPANLFQQLERNVLSVPLATAPL